VAATTGLLAGVVPRVRRILLAPKDEWVAIEAETTPASAIWTGYVIPLAGLSALAGLIGGLVFGTPFGSFSREMGLSFGWSFYLRVAVTGFVGSLVGVALLSWLVGALAPTFGARCQGIDGLKVAAYSYTAAWVAGLFGLVPPLSMLGVLGLYSIYLLYVGLKAITKVPDDKAIPYTISLFVVAMIVTFSLSWVTTRIF
jgi:hypothetical protein